MTTTIEPTRVPNPVARVDERITPGGAHGAPFGSMRAPASPWAPRAPRARDPWLLRRWRDLTGSGQRVIGLDIARGLAVLGMFAVHTGAMAWEFHWLDPSSWTELAWGNASATFAVLAGVAIAIISGRTRILDGVQLVQARLRILVRAALILVVGGILVALGTELVVIVEFYAVYFAMSLPFLRLRWWWLAAVGLGWLLVMPPVRVWLAWIVQHHGSPSAIVDFAITGFYPALTWFGYTLIGMAIGRMPLDRWWARLAILASGIVLATIANLTAMLLQPLSAPFTQLMVRIMPGTQAATLFDPEGHSGSTFDLASSAGVACIVIGVCLVGQRWLRWPLLPVAAIGSMSLTAYSAHALVFLLVPGFGGSPWAWLALAIGVGLACTIWRALLPKGPLEWLMSWASRRASDVHVRMSTPAAPIGSTHDDSRGLAVGRAIR